MKEMDWLKMADKYNMNIPGDIADFIQDYINTHPELGIKFVSQYVIQLLREDIKKLLREKSEKKKEKNKILIPTGEYTPDELRKMIKDH